MSRIVQFQPHDIFKDFKQIRLRPDALICYPPGAGGNFIASALGAQDVHRGHHNEYVTDDTKGCHLDPIPYIDHRWSDQQELTRHLDMLYQKAGTIYDIRNHHDHTMFLSHRIPLLSHMVYDMHSREIIVIDRDPESHWLIQALRLYKQDFHTDYKRHHWLIGMLINEAIDIGLDRHIPPYTDELVGMMLWHEYPWWPGLGRTPFVLAWIMRSLKHGRDLDISGFNTHLMNKLTDYSGDEWFDDYNTEVLERLALHADRITRISYTDLFIRQHIPPDSKLSTIHKQDIQRYSLDNLSHITTLTRLLSDENAATIREKISACMDVVQRA